jgi:hypothetical protein
MKHRGLIKGDEAYVSVRINKKIHVDIIVTAHSQAEILAEVHGSSEADLIAVSEALKACCGSIDYLLQKPTLKKLLEARIAELREEIAKEGSEPPYPADDSDIPF